MPSKQTSPWTITPTMVVEKKINKKNTNNDLGNNKHQHQQDKWIKCLLLGVRISDIVQLTLCNVSELGKCLCKVVYRKIFSSTPSNLLW